MVFFVAEIGSNWEGDVEKAKSIILQCKVAGANAVKFQMWKAEDLYDGKYRKYELDFYKATRIKEYCDRVGMEFFCSVFYPEAVDFLETLGVKKYKIATRTAKGGDPHCAETIMAVMKTGKQIITSYGNIEGALRLYCIPEYPADPEEINWEEALQYDGFSDHTLGIEQSVKYCKMNKDGILEKHVKLPDSHSPDSFFSITTQELATLIIESTS
jgi:N,N'-diacetyllegionaminate synthase